MFKDKKYYNKSTNFKLRKIIFIPMIAIFGVIILVGILNPSKLFKLQQSISSFQYDYFAWLYSLVALSNVFVLIWLLSSRHGDIILGGKYAKPSISRWVWFSITLCGGIGTGIVFWGIAEPIYHLHNPIPDSLDAPFSNEAALRALSTSIIHWGIASYSHYTLFGVAIGFMVYNLKLPFRICSVFYPLLGKKTFGIFGDIVDNISLFAIAVSVSAILAVAVLQLSSGLFSVFGIKQSAFLYALIFFAIVFTFIMSSYSGLLKGIKFLSLLNTKLFFALIIIILIFGHTRFTLFFSVEALGQSVSEFFHRLTYLSALKQDKWPMWWSIIYWVWMIVYAPMIGLFLAKIAKGRSIREFIIMNLFIPSLFTFIWFGVFGSNSIKIDMLTQGSIWEVIQQKGLEASSYEFLSHFPFPLVLSVFFMIVLFLSVVTLCDSMTSTISSLSISGAKDKEPPRSVKIFWGLIMSLVAFLSLMATSNSTSNAIDMVQSTKMLPMMAALPILFLFVGLIVSVVKVFAFRK